MSRRLALGLVVLLAALAWRASPATGEVPADQARQVTIFGIVATPGAKDVDGKLATVAAQLRKLKPDHGFQFRSVESERLTPGKSLRCDLGDDLTAEAKLVHGSDAKGNVQIAFRLERKGRAEFRTKVTTPANQLFFCEKPLPGGDRLLIGVSAR
jgi:hypothetical protein